MLRRWLGGVGRSLAAPLLLALTGCDDPTAPVASSVELQLRRIYDAAEWLQRVPVQHATVFYVRSKLASFVEELELPRTLEDRVLARLDAPDFVDELVPFLLYLREMYQAPEGASATDFDMHFRASFSPESEIPGITHDMFVWEQGDEPAGGFAPPTLPPEVARQLVALYDVLYLEPHPDALHVSDRLACETRSEGAPLQSVTRRATPSIRTLLGALHEEMAGAEGSDTETELADGIRGLIEDEVRLEAAAAAVVRFIDQTVCRNYRFFATRAFRARQLADWMRAELARPGGGALWRYLEHANQERRYGVVIVVDGLQGRLLEALARGEGDAPFVRTIVAEQERGGGPAPRARSLRQPAFQRTDFLAHLARGGFQHPYYLPFFRRLLASPHAAWVPVGVATTPTISVRNIPMVLTGAPVAGAGGTGLPNFHFVERNYTRAGERQGRGYYFFGSDAVELVSLTRRAGMRTLAERLPHLSSGSCTAQYDEAFHFGIDALLNLGLGERLRDFGDRLCAAELERRAATEREVASLRGQLLELRSSLGEVPAWWNAWAHFGRTQDRALAERWIEDIARAEQSAMPELLVYYNPWPDHFAHFEGPFADEIIAPSGELNRLDYWLDRIEAAYRDARVLPRTLFGMAGDHGLTPVFHLLNPEVEVFDALREEGHDFHVVKISSDEGEGPKLTNPFEPPSMKGIDVVVASTAGGNYMLDLFLDQRERFAVQPLARDLRALRPLRAPAGAPSIDLLAEITRRLADSLDYLAVRDAPCGPERCDVLLLGTRGGKPVEGLVRRRDSRIHYSFVGDDLLSTGTPSPYEALDADALARHARLRSRCLGASPEAPATWCDEHEWRRVASYTRRPDSVVQIAHLYDSPRAGTVNLFPRDGVGYNSRVPGRHAGESFHEKNAFVALWGEPVAPGGFRERSVVNGSVPVAIYQWLEGSAPRRGDEGWGFDPLPGLLGDGS